MLHARLLLLPLLLVISSLHAAIAETRYITDNLSIPLRDGTSSRHKILKMVKSGTAVEFIVKDKETGYSLIKVGKTEGWVPDSKLSRKPGAARQLERKKREMQKLRDENEQLKTRLAELQKGNASKNKDLDALQREFKQLQQRHQKLKADTANVMAIHRQNSALSEEVEKLTAERDRLRQENDQLKDRTARDWFLRGAGVIIAGILLGLVIPRIRFRRRDSWSSGY